MRTLLLTLILFAVASISMAAPKCYGKFMNPVSHVCWKCMFPLTIAGRNLIKGHNDNTTPSSSKKFFCKCGKPIPRIGVPIAFWEPFRVADVTMKKYCMVNLGGTTMNLGVNAPAGGQYSKTGGHGGRKESFYHVHWYIYPLMAWMNIISNLICMQNESFDIAYLTELDPLWDDDELTFWLNPEAILFANPVALLGCAADCASSSFGMSINSLFWCAGCRGGVYPLNGHIAHHNGGVDASTLALEKMIFKLHREMLLHGTTGERGMCSVYPMPWWKKNQYKIQMVYPKVAKDRGLACNPIGRTTVIWGANKEYPVKGEDFSYLLWRRRECCVL